MSTKRRGFASFTPDKLREVSVKGGLAKVPTKGFGTLTTEQRSENAAKAASIRWAKVKQARLEAQTEESITE